MNNRTKPPVAQSLTLFFDNNPTWGDLIWFAQQVRESGVDLAQEIPFEFDDEDAGGGPIGMSLFTHPDPAKLLEQ